MYFTILRKVVKIKIHWRLSMSNPIVPNDRSNQNKSWHRFVPLMGYWMLAYLCFSAISQTYVEISLTSIIITMESYEITVAHIMLAAAWIISNSELYRVSKAGIDNTYECISMSIFWVIMLIIWVIALFEPLLLIFKTTDYLLVLIGNAFTVGLSFIINGRTLMRTFGTSEG